MQNIWSESSSVRELNLAKKLLQFQRYQIFSTGGLLFMVRPVYAARYYMYIIRYT